MDYVDKEYYDKIATLGKVEIEQWPNKPKISAKQPLTYHMYKC